MLDRAVTSPVNWVLDNLVPPFLRDRAFFMMPLFWLLFGRRAREFARFKEVAPFLSKAEFVAWYARLADGHIQRESDLTERVAGEVLAAVAGESVLDVGSGRGYLARRLAERVRGRVLGADLHVPSDRGGDAVFLRADGEALPFPDRSFDTVTCCHVLEHVQDASATVRELRRVARRRLVVVVPRQREYAYTFDLHIRFFPYASSVQQLMKRPDARCEVVQNDFVYVEDLQGEDASVPAVSRWG